METFSSQSAKSMAANRIARRNEYPNGSTDEILEVLAAIRDALDEIIPTRELEPTIALVVIIAVQHHFVAPFRGPSPQVVHQ
jgi:hypothetical protein